MTPHNTPTRASRPAAGLRPLLTALLLVAALAAPGRLAAQTPEVFTAALMGEAQGQPVQRGTLMAHLKGDTLRLSGVFGGISSAWVSFALIDSRTSTPIETVYQLLPGPTDFDGGIEWIYALADSERQALEGGHVTAVLGTVEHPEGELSGTVEHLADASHAFDFRLSTPKGTEGGGLAALVGDELHVVGYYVNTSHFPVGAADLFRAAPGAWGEHVQTLFLIFAADFTDYGFASSVSLTDSEVQDLLDGRLQVRMGQTVRNPEYSGASGQLLQAPNRPPFASSILSPAQGTTLVIGSTGSSAPVDPETPLTTVAFAPTEDPDGNAVTYRWRVSMHPALNDPFTLTFVLGVDSTEIALTAGRAAALFDSLASLVPGGVSLDSAVTIYHQVDAWDGSLLRRSPTSSFVLVRGRVTAGEPEAELPASLALHGNYPNPFNPTTTVVFDLSEPAEVAIEVFDLRGRRVAALPGRPLAAGTHHQITLDGAGLASGTYLYRLVARTAAGLRSATGRMLLLK